MAERIAGFLTSAEVASLRAHAVSEGWKPGRQGTGYDILPLRDVAELAPLIARALTHVGTPFEDHWDVYLIRYLDGSSIPPHTDAAQHGRRHRRMNAVLEQATRGASCSSTVRSCRSRSATRWCSSPIRRRTRSRPSWARACCSPSAR